MENLQQELNETLGNYIHLDIETVKDAIKSLKNRRATGIGGISTELLKYGTDKLYELLRDLFLKNA